MAHQTFECFYGLVQQVACNLVINVHDGAYFLVTEVLVVFEVNDLLLAGAELGERVFDLVFLFFLMLPVYEEIFVTEFKKRVFCILPECAVLIAPELADDLVFQGPDEVGLDG